MVIEFAGWSAKQIELHRQAARSLIKIKDDVFLSLENWVLKTEFEARNFVSRSFKNSCLATGPFPPHVAFQKNTSYDEYYPSQHCLKFEPNSLVMLDIEARMNTKGSPFADITWTAYIGDKRPPIKMQEVFYAVIQARNEGINYIKHQLKKNCIPRGSDVDAIVKNVISEAGYGENSKHHTGHCLGFTESHGLHENIMQSNKNRLLISMGYTIEPGIYLPGKFGIRSEINFYINRNKKVIVTTPRQESLR